MEEKVLQFDQRKLVSEGKEIYKKLRDELEPQHRGEIVAIEVDSGEYFFGKTVIEATDKGREKYPDKVFYTVRVGFPVVYSYRLMKR
jgi:hypothetical protein